MIEYFLQRRAISLISIFVVIAIVQKAIEPAYYGFIVIYILLGIAWANSGRNKHSEQNSSIGIDVFLLIVYLPLILIITIWNQPDLRDVLRDVGAILSFFVGRYILTGLYSKYTKLALFQAFSDLGVLISFATIAAGGLAYINGEGSYVWRGEYIPPSHAWLPYILIINISLSKLEPSLSAKYLKRIVLCVVATAVSLSRTDFLLDALVAISILASGGIKLLSSGKTIRILIVLTALSAIALPYYLNLDVVQERIDSNDRDEDQSLEWRFIENSALLDQMEEGGIFPQAFGFGVGARLKLPDGVFDFDNNTAIPHMHNSFFTIILKFGIVGLILFSMFVLSRLRRWHREKDNVAYQYGWTGCWIVLLVLGKAVTLQGLTEWSNIMFFGFAFMLLDMKKID